VTRTSQAKTQVGTKAETGSYLVCRGFFLVQVFPASLLGIMQNALDSAAGELKVISLPLESR